MAVKKITSLNINEYANLTFHALKSATPNAVPRKKLADDLGLTPGQLSTVIKYMRRRSEENLDRYIPYYPISSKKGYRLPTSYSDFLPYYSTMYLWAKSILRTIDPAREKMERCGIDISAYFREEHNEEFDGELHNYLDDIKEMNGDTSWFFEE